jgi:hypothetical protein
MEGIVMTTTNRNSNAPDKRFEKDNNNTGLDSNQVDRTGNSFFRNLAGYNEIESYTLGGLIDDLYISLLCSKETVIDISGRQIVSNKYYLQAWRLQSLISIGRPPPDFVISLSDLNPKLKQDLNGLDYETKNFVINQAIGRIFENINPRLYHLSIARRLCWRMDP